MMPTFPPETPIEQDQRQEEERKRRRPRRGCSFLLGLILLLGFLFVVALFLFGSLFIGPDLPALSEGIGVVRIEGMILAPDQAIKEIDHFAASDKIRGILLRIESPGGAVGASQEIYDAILKAREGKPVYVSMGNMAASGGYYIAAAANRIFANPGTVTGSIGVIFNLTNWEELVEKVGLRFEVVKSGEFKDIGSGNRSVTDEERRLLQGMIDDTYDQFVEAILATRSEKLALAMDRNIEAGSEDLNPDSVENYLRGLADGRLYSGRQAFEFGLVDELGSMDFAADRLAEKVGLIDPELIESKRHPTLIDFLMGSAKSAIHSARGDSARLRYEMPVR